jgi:hypothetical protein
MIRAARTDLVTDHPTPRGGVVRLHEASWWAAVGGRLWGAAVAYRRPTLVASEGHSARIPDHLVVVRLVAVVVVTAAWLTRRSR